MNPQDEPVNLPQPQSSAGSTPGQSVAQDDSGPQTPAPTGQPDSANQSGQMFKEIALPPGAEDTDLIEKEWVERAKQIVEHTREDPYEQQRALSQMKADYLKKRYNKDIKVSDD